MNGERADSLQEDRLDSKPRRGGLGGRHPRRLGGDGLVELKKFVEAGGTLIGDGTTVEMLAAYGIAAEVSVSAPSELFTKGAIMRGVIADKASPLVYGYEAKDLPIYFSANPVISTGRTNGGEMGYFNPNSPVFASARISRRMRSQ